MFQDVCRTREWLAHLIAPGPCRGYVWSEHLASSIRLQFSICDPMPTLAMIGFRAPAYPILSYLKLGQAGDLKLWHVIGRDTRPV
jgi:hypothetical protein